MNREKENNYKKKVVNIRKYNYNKNYLYNLIILIFKQNKQGTY